MRSGETQVRIAWLIVLLVAAVGFSAIVLPGEQGVAAIETHAGRLADLAAQNEALVRRMPSLETTRTRVRDDLRRLAGKTDSGRVAVALLRVLDDEAHRNHVTISGIAPASGPAAGASTAEEDVDVSLRGRYRDVMGAIADVPHHDVLVEVRSVSLARVESNQLFPTVDATIHVALYHDVRDLAKEKTHAQTAAQ
jgi:hypothetical protein